MNNLMSLKSYSRLGEYWCTNCSHNTSLLLVIKDRLSLEEVKICIRVQKIRMISLMSIYLVIKMILR